MNQRNEPAATWPDPIPSALVWYHDVSGEQYEFGTKLVEIYPKYAMRWIDGLYGGYEFVSDEGSFNTIDGVREIEIESVLAFDSKGSGLIFCKS